MGPTREEEPDVSGGTSTSHQDQVEYQDGQLQQPTTCGRDTGHDVEDGVEAITALKNDVDSMKEERPRKKKESEESFSMLSEATS